MSVQKTVIKPILAGSIATILHKYGGLNQSGDYMSSIVFGGVVGTSCAMAELVEPTLVKLFKIEEDKFSPGKTFSSYAFQIALTSGIGYSVNRWIVSNDAYQIIPIKTVSAIGASNVLADLITDYM